MTESNTYIVYGADGYIGSALCKQLHEDGHEVIGVDNLAKRRYLQAFMGQDDGTFSPTRPPHPNDAPWHFEESDLNTGGVHSVMEILDAVEPDGVFNLAQIPSPTFSMEGPNKASTVQKNNVNGMLNLQWALARYDEDVPCVSLGTLGTYGLPDYDIPDGGFVELEVGDSSGLAVTPRDPGASLYHVSKTQMEYNAMFASKVWGVKNAVIQQGPVFGTREDTWHYCSHLFGTAIQRMVAQAVAGDIYRYGSGEQTRGYISLHDAVNALTTVMGALSEGVDWGRDDFVAVNQFDPDSVLSCNEIIDIIVDECTDMNLNPRVKNVENPRAEPEDHHYEPQCEVLPDLGWEPEKTVEEEVRHSLNVLYKHREDIRENRHVIAPRRTSGWEMGKEGDDD